MPILYLLFILVLSNSLAKESPTVDPSCDRIFPTREPCDGRNVTEEVSCLALVIYFNNTRCPIKLWFNFFLPWMIFDIVDTSGQFWTHQTYLDTFDTHRHFWTLWTLFEFVDTFRQFGHFRKVWTLWTLLDILNTFRQFWHFWTLTILLDIFGQFWTLWTLLDILDNFGHIGYFPH